MIMAAKALLDHNPKSQRRRNQERAGDQLCRCGVHNRVVRAVRRAATEIANDGKWTIAPAAFAQSLGIVVATFALAPRSLWPSA